MRRRARTREVVVRLTFDDGVGRGVAGRLASPTRAVTRVVAEAASDIWTDSIVLLKLGCLRQYGL